MSSCLIPAVNEPCLHLKDGSAWLIRHLLEAWSFAGFWDC